MYSSWFVLLTGYYSGDQIKNNEMGGACSSCLGEERRMQVLSEEIYKKEATWKTGMGGRLV
jgi:hypothetical protein